MSSSPKRAVQIADGLGVGDLFKAFWSDIAATWTIVAVENTLIALVPFLIGLSIDGLLARRLDELALMVVLLVVLGVISIIRRLYDTRAYGAIRVHLGSAVDDANAAHGVSKRSTRLDLSRELVDFLEIEVPDILTAAIQIVVSLVVLSLFDAKLAASSLAIIVGMLIVYGAFHRRFYRLNAALNSTREEQVSVLENGGHAGVLRYLRARRKTEVSLSDTEAAVYGGIFMLQIAYIAFNLTVAASLTELTAGRIFSIASYSWEYVEAALTLPMALQRWSRLSEITARISAETKFA